MKSGIHPSFMAATAVCGCGNTFTTISNRPEVRVEICNSCHPFYTGKTKFVDTAGRVQKFATRFQWNAEELSKQKSAASRKAPKAPKKPLPTKTKEKAPKGAAKVESAAPVDTPAPQQVDTAVANDGVTETQGAES